MKALCALITLLTACNLLEAPAPTLTPLPSATSTPVPSATPTPSVTPTVTPTATFVPTLTPAAPAPTPQNLISETYFESWQYVSALSWSPDGQWLAVAAGNSVLAYPVDSAVASSPPTRLDTSAGVNGLAFTPAAVPGAAWLALAGSDGSVTLWDWQAGITLKAWQAHTRSANAVSFSPDGLSLASAGNDAMLRLWNISPLRQDPTASALLLREMIGGAFVVPAVSFSPDGSLLAAIDLQTVRLRDPQTGRLVRTLYLEASAFCLAFSPDGQILAVGSVENTIQLWDVQSGQRLLLLSVPPLSTSRTRPFTWSLAFSPDGRTLASGGSDGYIRLWEMPSGELRRAWFAHAAGIPALAFDPTGASLASGGLDAVLRIWAP